MSLLSICQSSCDPNPVTSVVLIFQMHSINCGLVMQVESPEGQNKVKVTTAETGRAKTPLRNASVICSTEEHIKGYLQNNASMKVLFCFGFFPLKIYTKILTMWLSGRRISISRVRTDSLLGTEDKVTVEYFRFQSRFKLKRFNHLDFMNKHEWGWSHHLRWFLTSGFFFSDSERWEPELHLTLLVSVMMIDRVLMNSISRYCVPSVSYLLHCREIITYIWTIYKAEPIACVTCTDMSLEKCPRPVQSSSFSNNAISQ